MSRLSKGAGWFSRIRGWLEALFSRNRRASWEAPLGLRQQRGRLGERLACAFLRRAGYEIEATNVRFPVGELDIVAREGSHLCFVEVRSKSTLRFGSALSSINERKRRRIVRAARWYLKRRRLPQSPKVRFDVVAIDFLRSGRPTIELIRGAFTADR